MTPASGNSGTVNQEIEAGIQLLQRHAPAEAKARFSAAITLNPQSASALTWRGIAEDRLNDYAAAVRDFEAALQVDPSLLSAHYNLALTYIRLKDTHRALDEMKLVVNAEPGVLESQYNLALLLEQTGALHEAIDHLKAARKISPADSAVTRHLLLDLVGEGADDEAQPYLEELARTSPPRELQKMAVVLIESQHFTPAIYLLERAGQVSQLDQETRLTLARAYLGIHEDGKAINLLQSLQEADIHGEGAYLLGLAFADTGATNEAKDAFAAAVKIAPRNASALFHLGLFDSTTPDNLPIAIKHLRDAVQIEPENPTYRVMLGKLLLEHDEEREAETILANTHSVAPESGERDLLLGIAQIIVRGPASATAVLESSVKENPSLALSHNMLGFCYFSQGVIGKAAESYAMASDLAPQNRQFAHAAALAFERSGDLARENSYATRAASQTDATAADHLLLAKALLKDDNIPAAVQQLTEAIALDPSSQASYYLLVRCYMQEGNPAEASEWAEKLKLLRQRPEQALSAATKKIEKVRSSALLRGASIGASEDH